MKKFFLYVPIFLYMFILVCCKKSVTLVIDTSGSMTTELDAIKANVVKALGDENDVDQYLVMPVQDSALDQPYVAKTQRELTNKLNSLIAYGGVHDCVEDLLSGLKTALEFSEPKSIVFMFTDAYASDSSKINDIKKLCDNKKIKVYIITSGSCKSHNYNEIDNDLRILYKITRDCSGVLLRLNSATYRKGFSFMKEVLDDNWHSVITYDSHEDMIKIPQLHVDEFTSELLIAVSGDETNFEIKDKYGRHPPMNTFVDSTHSLVFRIFNPMSNIYSINAETKSKYGSFAITIYEKRNFPYEIGFSPRAPMFMLETSRRPMPGQINYMLIYIPIKYNIRIGSIVMEVMTKNITSYLTLDTSRSNEGYYMSKFYVSGDDVFKFSVNGEAINNNGHISSIPKLSEVIEPQKKDTESREMRPNIKLIDGNKKLVNYGNSATFIARIEGYPIPNVYWSDGDSKLNHEEVLINIPSVYVSYVNIDAVKSNKTVTCKVSSHLGENTKTIDVYVNRTYSFELLKKPEDMQVRYGDKAKLQCQVSSYPDAETSWYHNSTKISSSFSSNLEIDSYDNDLVIKKMTLNEVGTYSCHIDYDGQEKKYNADVTVTGLEAPELDIKQTEYFLKPEDKVEIECRLLRGTPKPDIKWSFKPDNGQDFGSIPYGVNTKEEKIIIFTVKSSHIGKYRCLAENFMGETSKIAKLIVKFPPRIKEVSSSSIDVNVGETVDLKCEVYDVEPKASIKWEVDKDGEIATLESRQEVSENNNLRFLANRYDTGKYRCIAENAVGKTELTYNVNVYSAPYINTPIETKFEDEGSSMTLQCEVLNGNPEVMTQWKFIQGYRSNDKWVHTARPVYLARGYGSLSHTIENISKQDEGLYKCEASNSLGYDSVDKYVIVNQRFNNHLRQQ